MTNAELKKIATKIAKCLALATSDNPGEAAAAKRQADALMKKYNLTSGEVAAADVHEKSADIGSPYRPPVYLSHLANVIAEAFGCGGVFHRGFLMENTCANFFGLGIKPELAAYTFDVLRRQLAKDRTAYSATLKRYKRANRIRKADLFCEAWVYRIGEQVNAFAGNESEKVAIDAYKQKRYAAGLKADTRAGAVAKQNNDWQASAAGYKAAEDVSLHKPVQAKRGALLGAR
ncbi:MAG: DUF2786 domain-containing protein [Methylomonas sp.]|jgi:hypothetical protein|uniref:DUF7168 domain-containing protein n=1 Tax=Methylomonas sp. TaxID=418 RepID=UPI0025D78A7E|nr:DUF2786 domain-containing protein [Methylomonas sp.]MCK9606224.1 DUF2786 domain-containing protein [Methylomonas sp.]